MGFPSLFERTSLIQVLPLRQGLHFCFNEAEEMRAQLAEFNCVVEVGILSEPGWISVWSLPSSVANCRRSGRLDLDA